MLQSARAVLVVLVLLTLRPVFTVAQVTSGTIVGSVKDSSGAGIPAVAVTVTNSDTGYSRRIEADDEGFFQVPLLPLGPYVVVAEKAGFSRYTQKGITLQLNQSAQLDITLNVGSVQESVMVEATAPLVDTRGSSLGEVVDQRTMRELPLNGRNPIQLASFTAGVSTISAPTVLTWTGRSGGQLTVHGSRGNENGYLLDGAHFTGMYQSTGMNYPSPDALQEFKLITNSYSAEYGRMVGSVFNAVTKSGTNDFHGSLWEFLRNDALNARNSFAPSVPFLRQNQFGATAGGRLKRDRVFLFGTYQGTRIREQRLLSGFPATRDERRGFFTQPAGRVLRNPETGQPYPFFNQATNTYFVDPATFNPVAARVANDFVPVTDTSGQLITLASSPSNNDQYLIKGDAQISPANRLTLTYFRDRTRLTDPARGSNFLNYSPTNNRADVWSGSVADTHSFTPTVLNEARIHYLRDDNFWDSPNKLTPGELGLVNYRQEGHVEPPTFNVSGRFNLGAGGNAQLGELGYRYQFLDTVTLIRGAHSFKMGGEVMRSHWSIRTSTQAPGSFQFTGAFTNDPLVDFFLGKPSQVNRGTAIYKDHVSWSGAMFFQDDWRVNRRLTLNLGLRWETNGPYVSKQGRGTVFRPGQRSSLSPRLPEGMLVIGDPGVPAGNFNADRNNFAPRVGIAFDPFGDGKTSVRASGGLFYGMTSPDLTTQPGSNPPWATRVTLFSPAGGLTEPFLGFDQPFPYVIDLANPLVALPQTILSIAPDYRDPLVYSWTFSIQRQLTAAWMLESAYVGKSSNNLNIALEANPARFVPGGSTAANINARRLYSPGVIGSVTESTSAEHASYHGLELTSRVRMQQGLTLSASYTWSKSLDGISSFSTVSRSNQDPFNRRSEKGPSDFDRTHVLSFSWVYDVPGISRAWFKSNRALGFVTDGWQFSGIGRLVSGPPFNVTLGFDNSLTGGNLDRPDVVGDMDLPDDRTRGEKIQRWFNPAAFRAAPQGSFGNAGRNIGRGPSSKTIDIGVFKGFALGERLGRVQFRAEFFNVLNAVNLFNPATNLNAGVNFGRITGAGSPRIAQLALKYLW